MRNYRQTSRRAGTDAAIADLYAGKASIVEIVAALNDQELATPRNAGSWSVSTVWRTLVRLGLIRPPLKLKIETVVRLLELRTGTPTLSFERIASTLNAEGHRTTRGNLWNGQSAWQAMLTVGKIFPESVLVKKALATHQAPAPRPLESVSAETLQRVRQAATVAVSASGLARTLNEQRVPAPPSNSRWTNTTVTAFLARHGLPAPGEQRRQTILDVYTESGRSLEEAGRRLRLLGIRQTDGEPISDRTLRQVLRRLEKPAAVFA
jgi:hypothetical protein